MNSTPRFRMNGPQVRRLAAEHNLTINEAADKLGVSRSYFSQLLAGARLLSPRVRRRLLARLPFRELSATELWEPVDASPCTAP